ncbi:MAG: TatD family hydrolase [Bacillales bacterium]|jgi:TatD DNase family protein|nr:TatD family hydrolase [Bacillales bacterium]
MIFNTHSHFYDEPNIKELYEKCLLNKVNKIALIGTTIETSLKAIEVANELEGCYATIGIHPSYADKDNINDLLPLLNNNKVIAIGEVGLDYHYQDNPLPERQKELFIKHIELANKYKLPLIIHIRDAYQDAYQILKENKPLYGAVMHCFSGNAFEAKLFIDLGFYISFAGYITFKNSSINREALKVVPLNKLLIETDDPYLTPVPFRGKKNEPSNVIYILKEIALILEKDEKELEEQIYNNSLEFFKI